MTTWAVTGASGFIGRALVRSLEADHIAVRTLSRRAMPRSEHVVGDVRDPQALRALIRGASHVVHLAAFVHRRVRSEADRNECFGVNVGATRTLVQLIAEEPAAPFLIHVSSASVYERSTPYGESKREAEELVLAAPVRAAILRPALVFGPGGPGNLEKLLAMMRRRVVPIVQGGRARKSLVPVENLVAAIRAVAAVEPAGEVFDVASETITMREIVDELARAASIHPLRIPLPVSIARLLAPAYVSDVVLDESRLRARTRYAPAIDVRTALRNVALAKHHQGDERDRRD